MFKRYVILVALVVNVITLRACIRYNHQTNMYYSTQAADNVNPIEYDDLARTAIRALEASFMEGVSVPRTMYQVIAALRCNGKPSAVQLANDLFLLMI